MTALASTDLTLTVTKRAILPKLRRHNVTIAFGDGALTYPAGGVPLPAYNVGFGFSRFLESLDIQDAGSADGFLYKLDLANKKIRIYQGDNTNASAAPNIELGAVAVAAKTLKVVATGW